MPSPHSENAPEQSVAPYIAGQASGLQSARRRFHIVRGRISVKEVRGLTAIFAAAYLRGGGTRKPYPPYPDETADPWDIIALSAGLRGCQMLLAPALWPKRSWKSPACGQWGAGLVEFAVSPQVGQAVLAFARSYSSSGPNSARAGGTACPTCQPLAIERNGSAHFPRQAKIAGRHQEF